MNGSYSTRLNIRYASPTIKHEIEQSAQKAVLDRQQFVSLFLLLVGGKDDDLEVVSFMMDDDAPFHPQFLF
jgi:hypothetical protein